MSGWVKKVVRDNDIVNIFPDRFSHSNGGPVILLFPLDLATECAGFLDDRENRHDGVEPELGVSP